MVEIARMWCLRAGSDESIDHERMLRVRSSFVTHKPRMQLGYRAAGTLAIVFVLRLSLYPCFYLPSSSTALMASNRTSHAPGVTAGTGPAADKMGSSS